MAATCKTQFPPPSYSSVFLPLLLTKDPVWTRRPEHVDTIVRDENQGALAALVKAVGERGLDLSSLLQNQKQSAANQPEEAPKKKSAFKKWRKSGNLKSEKEVGRGKESADRGADVKDGNKAVKKSAGDNLRSAAGKHAPDVVPDDMTLLQLLALNALDLTAPASDLLLKNRRNNWFQLTGHPDSFAPAGPGTIWKKTSGSDNNESCVYEALMRDEATRDLVPHYFREVAYQDENFIEMQDLLHGFEDPNVIDIKMGTRTFLESEVTNTVARQDLYQKMVKIDLKAPTEEEHCQQAVTKLRYMQFREDLSSTCSLGFRIEAVKMRGCPLVTNDLKKVKRWNEVKSTIASYLNGREEIRQKLCARLVEVEQKFSESQFFRSHEVVGSSILIIYDDHKVGAWMIDFAKTMALPNGNTVDHRTPWDVGNHEEGYLFGLDNLVKMILEISIPELPRKET